MTSASQAVPSWQAKAKCTGRYNLFYPHVNDQDKNGPQTQAAKAVCQECHVRDECLEVALRREEFGIWGGTTEKERRSLIRRRRHQRSGRG